MNKSQQLYQAERERESKDLYRVFNPTNQDIVVVFNVRISPEEWTIPAKNGDKPGESIVPNYVRIKYIEETVQRLIYMKSDELVKAENQKRLEKGFEPMDLHTTQARFESRNLKNLSAKEKDIVALLDGGLYKEFGVVDRAGRADHKITSTSEIDTILTGPKPVVANSTPPPDEKRQQQLANLAKAREARAKKLKE
jgi:hypothetical protein